MPFLCGKGRTQFSRKIRFAKGEMLVLICMSFVGKWEKGGS